MSFSKAQIDGEHFLTRSGSFSTVPHRNGRVDVMPKNAEDFEIPCMSIDEIRKTLIDSVSKIEQALKSGTGQRSALIENKIKLNQQLSYVNALKKSERSSKVTLNMFLLTSRVMLTESVFNELYSKSKKRAAPIIKKSRALAALEKKLLVLTSTIRELAICATIPSETENLQGAQDFDRDKAEIARCATIIELIKESYINSTMELVAKETLTERSFNIIKSISSSVENLGRKNKELKQISKVIGGKRTLKSIIEKMP